jgi:hypothetical protein
MVFPCCVVLKTGGQRFSMRVRFDAGICGEGARMWVRKRVRKDSLIDCENFMVGMDTRMGRGEALDRMDSEVFRRDLREEVRRAWAEGNGRPIAVV